MSTITELIANALTVECEKRTRENHYAPAVVAKYQQNNTQTDWWIAQLHINGTPIREWCTTVGLDCESLPILEQPFKSKTQAKRTMVEFYADRLEWWSPSADGYDSDEYLTRWDTIVASLKAGTR